MLFKLGKHSEFLPSHLLSNSGCMMGFCHKTDKNFKSLYGFGRAVSKLEMFVWIYFEQYFKVHNSVSVHPKSIILGQMANLSMICHVVVSVYQLKFETHPSSLLNFGTANTLSALGLEQSSNGTIPILSIISHLYKTSFNEHSSTFALILYKYNFWFYFVSGKFGFCRKRGCKRFLNCKLYNTFKN